MVFHSIKPAGRFNENRDTSSGVTLMRFTLSLFAALDTQLLVSHLFGCFSFDSTLGYSLRSSIKTHQHNKTINMSPTRTTTTVMAMAMTTTTTQIDSVLKEENECKRRMKGWRD